MRGLRSKRWVAGVAAAFVGLSVVAAAISATQSRDEPSLTEARLTAYQQAIHAHLRLGGRTVEQGMKPAVADLLKPGDVPLSAIAEESEAWVRDLTNVRARVAEIAPPEELREVARLFDVAMVQYVEAARLFGEAASADALQRTPIAERGIAKAREADRTYDDASRVIQRWYRRFGNDPTPNFPDPTPT